MIGWFYNDFKEKKHVIWHQKYKNRSLIGDFKYIVIPLLYKVTHSAIKKKSGLSWRGKI